MRSWEVWNERRAEELINKWGYPYKKIKRYDKLMSMAARLCVGKSVLDVGCGFGHLRYYLPDTIQYSGIDISRSMIAKARELNTNNSAKFFVGDVYDLSKFGFYDTVYALSLLIHLPCPCEPLEQLWTHAKKTVIFSAYVLDKEKLEIKDGGIIYRYESMESLQRVFNKLEIPHSSVEVYSFNDPELSYTKLFRLWK